MAERDKALVNILERLANEMTRQEEVLTDLLERQGELSKVVESTGLHLRGKEADSERSYDKLLEAIKHYRSDMLSLVNEQDRINDNIDELRKVLKTTTYTVDVTSQKLVDMSERLSRLEKASSEHYEHASKQPEIFRGAIEDSSRDFSKLHADTEKRLAELQKDVANQLNNFQRETTRRLLLLDGIVTSLEVLLVRTEPPEKKPLWIARVFIRLRGFFRRLFHRL